ncbi:MAG: FAD binding domain-containing protein, partial [Rudaea sp.]
MKFFDSYHLPATLDEGLDLLARYNGRARVIAGGTDLLIDLQSEYYQGERPHYDALIDVTRLPGACEILEEDGRIVIGCGVTHAQLSESGLIRGRATALAEAAELIGGPQVRNAATLVGNVAHALPAADGTVALLALGAEAQVARRGSGLDWRPLPALFRGPGQSAVDATREIITALRFPDTRGGEGSAFSRIMRPQGVALPILAMAARLRMSGGVIDSAAISVGPAGPVPFRAVRTEASLLGRPLSAETLSEAGELLQGEVSLRTSPH